MKDNQNEDKKVSLIFYSEEDGKRVRMDKWGIEIGKKYTIGRSKKKVDISIQDITISRIQAEFIFYDQNKIMIKDFNSSNGTYINKEKIYPYKEVYFSIKDIISIGDEKNELVFEVSKEIKKLEEEEKKKKREDFDDIKLKQNKINEENKNYFKKNQKNSSKSGSRESSYDKYKKEKKSYDRGDKNEKIDDKYNREEKYKNEEKYYKKEKYDKEDYKKEKEIVFDKEDKYTKKDRYNKFKYKNNINDKYKYDKSESKDKYRKRSNRKSRSRSRAISRRNSYSKYDKHSNSKNRRNRYSKESYYSRDRKKENDYKYENKEEKKQYKNISSYIIKKDSTQEEEIERESNKRQIALYNEYLKLKKEREENIQKSNLPSLIPLLVSRPKEEENYEDNEINNESFKLKPKIRSPRKRIRMVDSYERRFVGVKRRGGYFTKFRGRKYRRNNY